MKKLLVAWFILAPIVAAAADQSLPTFPEQKLGLPPLSLAEITKAGPLGIVNDAQAWFRSKSPAVVPSKKFVSKMPILSPPGDLDAKMVKAPDTSTDYKLIVKAPDVESVK